MAFNMMSSHGNLMIFDAFDIFDSLTICFGTFASERTCSAASRLAVEPCHSVQMLKKGSPLLSTFDVCLRVVAKQRNEPGWQTSRP